MTAQDDIESAIAANAIGPKRVQIGNESVEQQPVADQIAAANFVAGQGAASKPAFGLRFTKLVPPGGG